MNYQVDMSKQIPFWGNLTTNQQDIFTKIATEIRPCELFCKHRLMNAAKKNDGRLVKIELAELGIKIDNW